MEDNVTYVSLDDQYKHSGSIISRRIAGEIVLVPLRSKAADLEAIYALNDTAAIVWESLDGNTTLRKVLERVVSEFEVDEITAEKDLLVLMSHLHEIGAVEKL